MGCKSCVLTPPMYEAAGVKPLVGISCGVPRGDDSGRDLFFPINSETFTRKYKDYETAGVREGCRTSTPRQYPVS
jgi:hypothetical protein